jgi:hypothetical protein
LKLESFSWATVQQASWRPNHCLHSDIEAETGESDFPYFLL